MDTNVKFEYQYRDAGNYKKRGSIIFSNPDKLSVPDIERGLRQSMVQSELFIAHQINIPEQFLFYEFPLDDEDDHCFHEFIGCGIIKERPTDYSNRTIAEFIGEVKSANKEGWDGFSPFERLTNPK